MKDNIKTLLKYLLYAFLLVMVVIYGIKHPSALEKTLYSDNNNGTLSNSNFYRYGYINAGGVQAETTASVNTTINGTAIAFRFYYYEPVNLNNTYTMEINFMSNDLLKIFNSNMVHVYSCISDVCNPMSIISVTKNNPTGNSNKLTIEFNPVSAGSYIYTNLSNSTSATTITGISTFGIKNVNLTTRNNNQDIIDNQTNNTNNIINNNNSNTQEIIDNQNQNTQDIINSQYTCKNWNITLSKYIELKNNALYPTGISANNTYDVTEYIRIQKNQPYSLSMNYSANNPAYCLYSSDKTLISCSRYSGSSVIDFNSGNAELVRFSVRKNTGDNTNFGGIICLKDSQVQSNSINDLKDSLTDDSPVNMSSLGNVAGWLPPGPIDSIINLPLNMLNALFSALSGTCQPLHIPIPYLDNRFIDIPCISTIFSQIQGLPTFWSWVGLITSTLMLYRYLISLYKYYDDLTTLKANFISDFGGAP